VPFSCDRSIEDVGSLIMITRYGIMPSKPFCVFSSSCDHHLEKLDSNHARPLPFFSMTRGHLPTPLGDSRSLVLVYIYLELRKNQMLVLLPPHGILKNSYHHQRRRSSVMSTKPEDVTFEAVDGLKKAKRTVMRLKTAFRSLGMDNFRFRLIERTGKSM
jgi:hypothetical protein